MSRFSARCLRNYILDGKATKFHKYFKCFLLFAFGKVNTLHTKTALTYKTLNGISYVIFGRIKCYYHKIKLEHDFGKPRQNFVEREKSRGRRGGGVLIKCCISSMKRKANQHFINTPPKSKKGLRASVNSMVMCLFVITQRNWYGKRRVSKWIARE